MRTLVKVTIPVESGNKTLKDGTLPKVVQGAIETWKPEAAYFFAENGKRTGLFVIDLKDASQIPAFAEPFFMQLNADVQFLPVMNAEDLQRGLQALAGKL
jgi:hypothetical protein